MAKGRPTTLVGLELGNAKAAVLLARADSDFLPQIIGVGESYALGMQKGVVVDARETAASILQALEKAGKPSEVKKLPAYIACGGSSVLTRSCRVSLKNKKKRPGDKLSSHDMIATGVPATEKVLAIIPATGTFDFLAAGLELDAYAVTTSNSNYDNLIESARYAGLTVCDILYSPLVAAEAILSPAEKELGTLLIDFGATTTTVSVISRGVIRENAILAIGCEHVVTDLAIGLHASLAEARAVLQQYTMSDRSLGTGGADLIDSIISARTKEIMEMIAVAVKRFVYSGQLPGGAVIYGEVANIGGISFLAEKYLQFTVRVGIPQDIKRKLGPHHVNIFGLVKYGFALCRHNDQGSFL